MKVPVHSLAALDAGSIEQLRRWRNQPRIRANMRSDAEISPAQQAAWFRGLAGDASRRQLLLRQDGRPVGSLYFSDIDGQACHWGCYVGEDAVWPGTGLVLEAAALDYAFDRLDVELLVAEVLETNRAPIRMHQVFGYHCAGPTGELLQREGRAQPLLRYEYRRADWRAGRAGVVGRLPAQIARAIAATRFEPATPTEDRTP